MKNLENFTLIAKLFKSKHREIAKRVYSSRAYPDEIEVLKIVILPYTHVAREIPDTMKSIKNLKKKMSYFSRQSDVRLLHFYQQFSTAAKAIFLESTAELFKTSLSYLSTTVQFVTCERENMDEWNLVNRMRYESVVGYFSPLFIFIH